eukprot:COSAG06_NODE_1382_length_9623_cov_4.820559_4_plen_92_part_00
MQVGCVRGRGRDAASHNSTTCSALVEQPVAELVEAKVDDRRLSISRIELYENVLSPIQNKSASAATGDEPWSDADNARFANTCMAKEYHMC